MHSEYLSQDDHQNLLRLSIALYGEPENYLDTVLLLLKELFQWQLSMYYVLNRSGAADKPVVHKVGSLSLEQSLLQKCKDAYINDRLVHNALEKRRFSKGWTGVMFTQDMNGQENYVESTFHRILSEVGIYYTAVCLVSLSPEIKINIFKTVDEGPFTPREKALIGQTQQVIFAATKQQVRAQDTGNVLRSFKSLLNSDGIGCLVVDSYLEEYAYNDLFWAMASQVFDSDDIHTITQKFTELFAQRGIALRQIREKTTIRYKGYSLSIIPRASTQHGYRGAFHLLTIKAIQSDGVVFQDSLTSREREVLALMIDGSTNMDISVQLHISQHTVKTHITNIFHKLNVTSRAGLFALFNKGM